MRTHHATGLQVMAALIVIAMAAFTPAIRVFVFDQIQPAIIGVCIAGILFLQLLKIVNAREKRLKTKIKDQSQLIDKLLLANTVHVRLLKDIVLPELFEHHGDHLIARLHASGINISELMNYGIDRNIIAHYELFYYLGKAKEQQELINGTKKANGDIVHTPILKDINEADHSTYSLHPISA